MVKHYLITVATHERMNVHGYLMSGDKQDVYGLADKMFSMAEERGLTPLGIVLSTELAAREGGKPDPRTVKTVREIVCKVDKEAQKNLKAAKDFHLTVFLMSDNYPDNEVLMALH